MPRRPNACGCQNHSSQQPRGNDYSLLSSSCERASGGHYLVVGSPAQGHPAHHGTSPAEDHWDGFAYCHSTETKEWHLSHVVSKHSQWVTGSKEYRYSQTANDSLRLDCKKIHIISWHPTHSMEQSVILTVSCILQMFQKKKSLGSIGYRLNSKSSIRKILTLVPEALIFSTYSQTVWGDILPPTWILSGKSYEKGQQISESNLKIVVEPS